MMEHMSTMEHAETETPNEVLLSDEQRDWHNRIGPCPGCGKRLDYTHEECVEMIETDDRLRVNAPGLSRQLLSMSVYCHPCDIRMQDEARTAANESALYRLYVDTYSRGLMPDVARGINWEKSSGEIEARNAVAFQTLRGPRTKNIWIIGPPGTGKTFAARCVLASSMKNKRTVGELSAISLVSISKDFHSEKLLRKWADVSVLLIDDIDKPTWTPPAMDCLFGILDRRSGNQRILITSNQLPENVGKVWNAVQSHNATYANTLFERLLPMERVYFEGNSLRREAVL